jgi:hypothetical protein
MGMRRTSECIETPIVRLFLGKTTETKSIVAGSEIADQEMNKTAPMMAACQDGKMITIEYPAMAIKLNISKARL